MELIEIQLLNYAYYFTLKIIMLFTGAYYVMSSKVEDGLYRFLVLITLIHLLPGG